MFRNFYYFRPGEESRMLARCQFGITSRGCGATLTYPIKGYPWRRCVIRSYSFDISEEIKVLLFNETHRIKNEYPEECLAIDKLWNDHAEKGNAITRDRDTNILCHDISIISGYDDIKLQYSIKENSPALINSELYKLISKLIEPHEHI